MKKQIGKKLWLKGLEHVVTSAVENKSKVHQGATINAKFSAGKRRR